MMGNAMKPENRADVSKCLHRTRSVSSYRCQEPVCTSFADSLRGMVEFGACSVMTVETVQAWDRGILQDFRTS
jgi:hypothetical protein